MVLEGVPVIYQYFTIDTEARIAHDRNLIAVLERFKQHHVELNVDKTKFLLLEATSMGDVITTDGLQLNPVTVQTVVNIPNPVDKEADHIFYGTINYLSKLYPQLSNTTQTQRKGRCFVRMGCPTPAS